ncbi:MAG: hypothetical protein JRJ78_08165 [Deltaproteobacteria bacterium]|nr:hypothetical protein [Deltaproteobacteria bacterium]
MKFIIPAIFGICIILSFHNKACAGGRVLLVHSYYADYTWTDDITGGVKSGLAGSGAQLEIFYMNTKRRPREECKIQAGKEAMERVRVFRPHVVIAADDNAQAYFSRYYVGKERPQIVFCGVNGDPADYGFPAANVTGIVERPHFVQTFDMLKIIVPDVRKVAVITDNSTTSNRLISQMRSVNLPVEVVVVDQPDTFTQWKKRIKSYQKNVDAVCVILYHTLTDGDGDEETVSPLDVMEWTVANNRKPIEQGALFGVVNSGYEQGLEAAKIALEILKGRKAGEFPIVEPKKGAVYINVHTAQKMGFEIPFPIMQATDRMWGSRARGEALREKRPLTPFRKTVPSLHIELHPFCNEGAPVNRETSGSFAFVQSRAQHLMYLTRLVPRCETPSPTPAPLWRLRTANWKRRQGRIHGKKRQAGPKPVRWVRKHG